MITKKWSASLLAIMVVPLHLPTEWESEKFSKIKSNQVEFSPQGIRVQVDSSASPLIYTFNAEKKISGFKVTAKWTGLSSPLHLEDSPLRLGIIRPGTKRLNAFQRLMAPAWIKKLYQKAPPGKGIDSISFYNFTSDKSLLGKSRQHPKSNLIKEHYVLEPDLKAVKEYSYQLKEPVNGVGLWLSIDGDDTPAKYSLEIQSLSLIIVD